MSTHFEGLGDTWHCLLNDPEKEIPDLVAAVMAEGGTRPTWLHKTSKKETVLMAYPAEATIRGAVIVQGEPEEKKLSAKSAFPLLEGLPNDMTIVESYMWHSKVEGAVAARRNEDGEPIWFYTPLLFRDKDDLTPDVRQTILLAGLTYGLRRALVDELTISSGPVFEEHLATWLEEHPGASRLDAPQLTVPLAGARILSAGKCSCEYQFRAPITSVEETNFGPHKVYMLHLQFGLTTPNPLDIMVYAPERVCGGYEPKAGDEIDGYVWLQGRMLDF